MIRVAHISSARNWRGAEQQIALLLQATGQEVFNCLFCPEGSELARWGEANGIQTGTYRKLFGMDLAGAIRLRRFLQEQEITIVHLHDSHALNLYWLCGLMGLDIPAVLTRHVNFQPSFIYKYKLRGVRSIICVSEAVRDTMRHVAGSCDLRVIYPGINPAGRMDRETLKRDLGLDPHFRLVGMVGALEAEKDPLAFVRIAEPVVRIVPDVCFVLLGEGRLRSSIEQAIADKGLSGRVKLAGYRNDLGSVIGGLDLVLHTAVSEGFPLALLEAMQAGILVVGRELAGLSEMIRNGKNGFLYQDETEAAAQVKRLLEDPILYDPIREQACVDAGQFSAERMIEKTHTLYREILI